MKRILWMLTGLVFVTSHAQSLSDIEAKIWLHSRAAEVSPSMYGVFFEEINHAGEGGLYGEMLKNRSFEDGSYPEGYHVENQQLVSYKAKNYGTGDTCQVRSSWDDSTAPGWMLDASSGALASMHISTDSPRYATAPSSLNVIVEKLGKGVSLVNQGFWGLALKKDAKYRLRMIVRSTERQKLQIRLLDDDGQILGKGQITVQGGNEWTDQEIVLSSSRTVTRGKLSIDISRPGTVGFDYVSLFPTDTYKDRRNGMRKDVALMIDSLHPRFLRWPGGCVVEGITLNNRIKWKETLGDPASRSGEYDLWGYRNSYGFGYQEFLDFCEDLGAKGMFVCNVGMSCTGQTGETCDDEHLGQYLQEALDAIEFAIGDTTTFWGHRRAELGHSAPYPLHYVEIGNENFGPIYQQRYDIFYEAIKRRYPQLVLISNFGAEGDSSAKQIDMVDPHWYVEPKRFFRDAYFFDTFPRNKYKVYVGEYSCNDNVGSGNMWAALGEAAFLTGAERNSDVVKMLSYAPLFENKYDRAWPVNLIWISGDQVVGRSSYYVQKMFANHVPSYNLQTDVVIQPEKVHETMADNGYAEIGRVDEGVEVRNLSWHEDQVLEAGDSILFEFKSQQPNHGVSLYWGMRNHDHKKALALNIGKNGHESSVDVVSWGSHYPFKSQTVDSISANDWHQVEFKVLQDGFEYYLDHRLLWKYQTPLVNRKFLVAGYDEKSQEAIVKMVNAKGTACHTVLHFMDGKVDHCGRMITLKANHPTDENSFEYPYLLYPEQQLIEGVSEDLKLLLPPYSVNIFRVKCLF